MPVSQQTEKAPKKPVRHDPRPRHATGAAIAHDGTPLWARVKNADPRMHYAMPCCIGTDTNSIEFYESIGYVPVLWTGKDGPRLEAGRTSHNAGDVIEFNGHRLMQITREEYERIEREGHDGVSGQNMADMYENRIRRQNRADNPFAEFNAGYGASGTPYAYEDKSRSDEE